MYKRQVSKDDEDNGGTTNGHEQGSSQHEPSPVSNGARKQPYAGSRGRFSLGDYQAMPPPKLPKATADRNSLPVWSSTGVIPFAAREPPPQSTLGSETAHWIGNGVSRTMLSPGDVSASATPDPTKETDVWEVPETPQK